MGRAVWILLLLVMQREETLRLQKWLEHILTPLEKRVLFYH